MPESLTLTGMSAPHREMMTGLVNDLADQIAGGIALSRGMTVEAVKELINGALLQRRGSAETEADRQDRSYYDQMLEEAKRKAGCQGRG